MIPAPAVTVVPVDEFHFLVRHIGAGRLLDVAGQLTRIAVYAGTALRKDADLVVLAKPRAARFGISDHVVVDHRYDRPCFSLRPGSQETGAVEALLFTGDEQAADGLFERDFREDADDFEQAGQATAVVVGARSKRSGVHHVGHACIDVGREQNLPFAFRARNGHHHLGDSGDTVIPSSISAHRVMDYLDLRCRTLAFCAHSPGFATGNDIGNCRSNPLLRAGLVTQGVSGVESHQVFDVQGNAVGADAEYRVSDPGIHVCRAGC